MVVSKGWLPQPGSRARIWSLVAIGLTASMLCSCGPTPEEQRAMDQQSCAGFGFQPGTDAFANCMMQTSQQRAAQNAADQRAWQQRQAQQQQADQLKKQLCQRQAAVTPGMICN